MLMACNIAAWQSTRTRKIDSIFSLIRVWAHFSSNSIIG